MFTGVVEGGIALLIALAGGFILFGQIKENAKRNEEDIRAIKVMIERYQQAMHDLLEKSMVDMKELLDANKEHQRETMNVEILHLRDLISMTNNEVREDIKRIEIQQKEIDKFRERLALVVSSVKSLHHRLDLEVPALLDDDRD
jgi:hypothetical protein